MKYQKPGKKKKKSRKIKRPKELICAWCGNHDETCCLRHAEDDIIKYLSGGGIMGSKINNRFTVLGCFQCDLKYSKKPNINDFEHIKKEHSKIWAVGILRTWKPDIDTTGLHLTDLIKIIKKML